MSDRKKKILIVDDDQSIHLATKFLLKNRFECISAYNGDEGKAILSNQVVDLVLLDLHMRKYEEGLDFLPIFKALDPDLDIIIVSSNTEIDLAGRASKLGASAYLHKDHSPDQLFLTIESVISKRGLLIENKHYVSDRKRNLEKNKIIGTSPKIQELLRNIEKIKLSNANVIITADTGSGKEMVARHIGMLDGKPFVTIDSATINSSLAESMLFGYEKGAFTGANTQAKGLFEEANGGTIYFDEISNMPLEIQSKLLRVIQEKEIIRLGSTKVLPLDFRVICATNKNLEKLVQEGKFKDDLYQRLNVISIEIPNLSQRKEDIRLLIEHFIEKFSTENSPKKFSSTALEALMAYSWPGNIRELSNLIANLCVMCVDQDEIGFDDLPNKLREPVLIKTNEVKTEYSELPLNFSTETDYYAFMRQIEGQYLQKFYKMFHGNVGLMSKSLKISRSNLYSKLTMHGLLN